MAHPFRLLASFLFLLLLGALHNASAQASAAPGSFAAGVRGGFYLDDGAPAVGLTGLIPLGDRLFIEPGIELELYDSRTKRYAFDVCGRLTFPIARNQSVLPYAEVGIGYEDERYDDGVHKASQGNVRVNIVGGSMFNAAEKLQYWGGIRVFGAFRADFSTDVVLQLGALYWF